MSKEQLSITNPYNTVAGFKGFLVNRDQASFGENPTFTSTVGSNLGFLHINTVTPTQIESSGQSISGFTDDYDGDVRNATTPDIGADEFAGVGIDLTGPVISYTPLANTNSLLGRTLSTTITDASGVPTAGIGLPVLYWKINAGAYSGVQGVFVSGNTYSFTFGAGVVVNDVVSYFVVAQDVVGTPNVNGFPAGGTGYTANPPNVTTPTSTPSTYLIVDQPLSGDYTVGSTMFNKITGKNITFEKVTKKVMKEIPVYEEETKTKEFTNKIIGTKQIEVDEISWVPTENGKTYTGDLYVKKSENPNFNYPENVNGIYATITAAVADLNLRGVSGPVRFLLNDVAGYTTETLPITIDITNANLPTASNTVTFKPNTGVTTFVSGSSATSVFKLNGADYIIFDGSNAVSGTSKDMSVTNTATTSGSAVMWLASKGIGAGATNNTIKNCILNGGANTSGIYNVFSGGSTIPSNGADNDFNTIQNNSITKAYYGININGSSSATVDNLNINNNLIGSTTAGSEIKFAGIYLTDAVSSSYSNNTIFNITQTSSFDAFYVGTGVSNSTFNANLIKDIINNGTNRASAFQIVTGTGSNNTFSNNVIHSVINNGTAGNTFGCYGFYIISGSGINLYFNSINMYGDRDAVTTTKPTSISSAIYIGGGSTLNIRDNIFVNTQTAATNFPKSYSIYSGVANSAFSQINYNDYFVSGAQGVLGFLSADQTTLAAWQTATAQDVNSQSANPPFTSNTDLRLQLGSTLLGAGTAIGGITTDYLGVTRGTPPTIGAYEVGLDAAPPAITYTAFSNTSSTTDRTLTATVTDYSGTTTTGSLVPRIYYKKGIGGTWFSRAGVLQTGSGTNGTWNFTIVYSDFGGVILGDFVYYYVIAQDIAAPINIGSVPSAGLVATDVNTVTTPPTTPYDYKIVGTPLTGTYTIGLNLFNRAIGKNLYGKTLTRTVKVEAPAIVNQVDDKVSSNNESKGTKVEQNSLMTPTKRIHNKYNEDSKSEKKNYIDITEEYTVLYENDHPYTGENYISTNGKGDAPNGIYSTITAAMADLYERGTSGNVIFTLVDNAYNVGTGETFPIYVINPGSFNVTMKPTLPNTVISSSTVPSTDVLMYLAGNNVTIDGAISGTTRDLTISSTGLFGWTVYFGANSSGNTLKNCKVNCGSTQSSTGVVQIEGGTSGTGSNNHTVDNCEIYDVGTSRPEKGVIIWGNTVTANGNTVKNNDIHDYGNSNGGNGVYITANANNNLIQKNNIYTTTTPVDASSSTNYGIYLTGVNTGMIIEQNNIHDLANANAAGAIKGIYLFGATGARDAIVRNNSISLGSAFPMNGATIYGIDDFGFSLNTWYIYYNSVRINGTATTGNSYCFAKRDVTNQEFFNNVGYNNRSGGTANYGIFVNTSGTSGTINMNYNGYYADGTGGSLGFWNATPQATLSAWQTASGKDANSVTGDPLFISATNLHIQTSGVSPVSNAGTYIATALNDIDGDVRSLTTPDIGADEYSTALSLGLTAMLSGYCNGATMNYTKDVTVELHAATTPYALVESQVVTLSTSGVGNPVYTTAVNGTPYYIVIKSNNGLETWSATPQTFTGSTLTYDFTSGATQAYGSNMHTCRNKMVHNQR